MLTLQPVPTTKAPTDPHGEQLRSSGKYDFYSFS